MARYRKRAGVTVEAQQWFPDREIAGVQKCTIMDAVVRYQHYVTTAHGQSAYLEPGDWVITEPDGSGHYPCKPDIFDATYELDDGVDWRESLMIVLDAFGDMEGTWYEKHWKMPDEHKKKIEDAYAEWYASNKEQPWIEK